MLGRDLFRDEPGREVGCNGLSEGKKLDLLLRGDGDGGICDSVSMVRSEREGLGLLGSVRPFSIALPAASLSNSWPSLSFESLAAACSGLAAGLGSCLADPIGWRASGGAVLGVMRLLKV